MLTSIGGVPTSAPTTPPATMPSIIIEQPRGPTGVQFPIDASGKRSTLTGGKTIFAAAAKAVETLWLFTRQTSWLSALVYTHNCVRCDVKPHSRTLTS